MGMVSKQNIHVNHSKNVQGCLRDRPWEGFLGLLAKQRAIWVSMDREAHGESMGNEKKNQGVGMLFEY